MLMHLRVQVNLNYHTILHTQVIIFVMAFLLLVACTPTNPSVPPVMTPSFDTTLAQINQYRQNEWYTQAQTRLNWLAETQGWSSELSILAGDIAFEMQDYTGALTAWERALTFDMVESVRINLLGRVADHYIQTRRWADAFTVLTELTDLAPDNLWGNYQLGLLLAPSDGQQATDYLLRVSQDEQYSDIVTSLLTILAIPDDTDAFQIGAYLADAQLFANAEYAFEYAHLLAFPNPLARAYQGLMRDFQGLDGKQLIAEALQFDDESPEIYWTWAVHHRLNRNFEAHETAILRALELDPENALFYGELALNAQMRGDTEQAEEWFAEAINASGSDTGLTRLFVNQYGSDDFTVSQEMIASLFITNDDRQDDATVQSIYGWTLVEVGEIEAGREQISEALIRAPDNVRAQFDMGRLLLQIGDIEIGRTYLTQVAQGNSEYAIQAQALLDDTPASN